MKNNAFNKKSIQEKINMAKDLTLNVDEAYKIPSFQIVLSKLLDHDFTEPLQSSFNPSKASTKQTTDSSVDLVDRKKSLAKKCSITLDNLNDLILFKDDKTVQLLFEFDSQLNPGEKLLYASQCISLALEVLQDDDWITASALSQSLSQSGINSHNMSKQLSNKTVFSSTGSKKGTKYRLTGPAKARTCKLFADLIKKQSGAND